ncbi:MAG TPA: hypothetical protein VIY51_26195 [Xanthobacteraceae bacterium]
MCRINSAVLAAAVLACAGLGLLGLTPATAQNAGLEEKAPPASDAPAPKRAHPPVRIRVHPLAQSYPGPDAVRQCTSWLATEFRPSGTVIVPKMHCWWERG